ncbi:hypothetical protein PU560_09890 [Georgenia sp. 10Sc9-8]|uniref:ABM domain-containing protein n=1 Tax=Georgenia halotolerans TaxID=3028317 RepID=A0ABT5TXK5_9MICO|nr:hypothetical protein [Georgenia halotolerans]
MAFIQLIEYTTSRPEDVAEVTTEWERATRGKRSARRVLSTKHHEGSDRYCDIVFFDSYESAMENSQLPETQEYARKMGELIDGEPTYRDLDVVEDLEL